jgi:hypothetical protein
MTSIDALQTRHVRRVTRARLAAMRVAAATLVALAVASASAGATTTADPASGLRGVVMRGPTSPVCIESEPCDEPAAGVVLRFSRSGTIVARVTTGPQGGYEVRLRHGMYRVTTPHRRVGVGLSPRVVRVLAGRFGRVDFHLDTGIQ